MTCSMTDSGAPTEALDRQVESAWSFWRRIGAPRRVLAPLVAQSELAFRMLARQHGAQGCWTPMLHADLLTAADGAYLAANFDPHPADRPLVVQLCGNDAATLIAAARLVQGRCDAIELNCGCPQGIAQRGLYGAFLLDDPASLAATVRELASALSVPLLVKLRMYPLGGNVSSHGRRGERGRGARDQVVGVSAAAPPVAVALETETEESGYAATVALALRLQCAGCSALTVHGRSREQKSSSSADWGAIAAVKAALRIPVIANGGVETTEELEACLSFTGADAVMCGEGALENVGIFNGTPTSRGAQYALAAEYAALAQEHKPLAEFAKAHMVKMLHMALNDDTHEPQARAQIKSSLEAASSLDAVLEAADRLCEWEAAAERAAESAVGRTRTSTFRQRCDRTDAAFVSWCARLYLRCAPGVHTVDMPFQHTRAGIDAIEPMAQRAAH